MDSGPHMRPKKPKRPLWAKCVQPCREGCEWRLQAIHSLSKRSVRVVHTMPKASSTERQRTPYEANPMHQQRAYGA